MTIPCVQRLSFVVAGLSFLQPALTTIQYDNLTLIATALILGSGFNLSKISRMWLAEKSVSTLSHFLSDAKFSTWEMQMLYIMQIQKVYKITEYFYIIDDTLNHHSRFCKWIHGIFILFDHVLGTNVKALCIVILYLSDGGLIKCPLSFRIYYQDTGKVLPWQRRKQLAYQTKYELAIEMLEGIIESGWPHGVVLADSWYGIRPFIKELSRLNLTYVIEIKADLLLKTPCQEPKRTPTGRLTKKQYDLIKVPAFFRSILLFTRCGFSRDIETGKKEKVLYYLKIATVRFNAFPGKYRLVESVDPTKHTTKYLLTNQLTWEATKIISVYSHRWVIEEFFRNAKQLLDMDGVMLRSEQGITLALCLVSWLDFLLHFENHKRSTTGELPQEPVTIPSIICQAQYENLEGFVECMHNDEDFVHRWCEVEKKNVYRKRKKRKELIKIEDSDREELGLDHGIGHFRPPKTITARVHRG
ncbi:MAG: transposase [Candidatus Tectomicrobia bacterium]|nr:transposase [Candidatus Tectomicrobia bacterium]